MSPTERIATALLGWQPFSKFGKNQPLPNLSTLDGCAEFERVLAEKDLCRRFMHYFDQLRMELGTGRDDIFFATPEQRVAACLKVLDQMEGE